MWENSKKTRQGLWPQFLQFVLEMCFVLAPGMVNMSGLVSVVVIHMPLWK